MFACRRRGLVTVASTDGRARRRDDPIPTSSTQVEVRVSGRGDGLGRARLAAVKSPTRHHGDRRLVHRCRAVGLIGQRAHHNVCQLHPQPVAPSVRRPTTDVIVVCPWPWSIAPGARGQSGDPSDGITSARPEIATAIALIVLRREVTEAGAVTAVASGQ